VTRRLLSVVLVAGLLAFAVLAELQMARAAPPEPPDRELLYLPSPEMLKLLSVGNPALVADVLYLWSIQYYSLFEPHERFLYLETVYQLITDLDPLYFDAYRIGALIMQIQTGGDQRELQQSVERLFDKGLSNMPQNWQLAEAAAWDMYMRFHDHRAALKYAEVGSTRPGAPARLKRMVGVWRDTEKLWTVDDSIAYWRQALDEAQDPMDRAVCLNKLYDAVATKDRQQLQPRLEAFSDRFGRCAASWDELVRAGLLQSVPLDLVGNAYGIDQKHCTVVPLKKISQQ
jgi:hypothetical protein